ncbi:hypothetical protein E2E68_23545, partial [Salmonella enterica subsp. enterica serovar Kentucky]|uniref:Tn3 family transposase n=1 Tax=Salmonella enterica TaxID=28901 RepID=UPI00113EAA02
VPAYGPQNDVTLKMPAFEWVHVQLHQQKGMISLSPPTICNSALDGLLYHESDLRIEEHYTDTAGFTDHVFALMHLLGFRFAPRI